MARSRHPSGDLFLFSVGLPLHSDDARPGNFCLLRSHLGTHPFDVSGGHAQRPDWPDAVYNLRTPNALQ